MMEIQWIINDSLDVRIHCQVLFCEDFTVDIIWIYFFYTVV